VNINVRRWSNEVIEIAISGMPLPLLNALRRYALAKVPTYAVDEVMVVINTSHMFDEMLAHRIAMIPLRSEEALERVKELDIDVCSKCGSDSEDKPPSDVCEKCYVHMFLEAVAEDSEYTVYSSDIKSEDEFVKPVYGNIPIVILSPGQRISLELRARVGRGIEHIKWSPATIAVTRYVADIKISEDLCNLCKKCIEVCPKNVLTVYQDRIQVKDKYECILCKQCMYACPTKAIDVSYRDNEYILVIESSGALEPETILRESIGILLNELEIISKSIDGWKR